MIPLIAESAPEFTAGQLYATCTILVFILTAVLLVRRVFGHEPPLHKEYVSREVHDAFAKKMDEELGRERGARKLIHQEIATLQGGVEVVKAQNAHQSATLADLKSEQSRIRDRIDDVPQRTINLLRNTSALK